MHRCARTSRTASRCWRSAAACRSPACASTTRSAWRAARRARRRAALSGLEVDGYEIHHGESAPLDGALRAAGAGQPALRVALNGAGGASPLGWQLGPVLAVYLHGIFENHDVVRALFGRGARPLDAVFDTLAGHVDAHFDPGFLLSLVETR